MGIVDEFIRDYAGKGREIGWLSERAEMTKSALDTVQDKLVDENRQKTLEEFKKTEGEKPKPRERSNFYTDMASREVDDKTNVRYTHLSEARFKFQTSFSGDVSGDGVDLTDNEKAALASAILEGNMQVDEDGLSGYVIHGVEVYDFDIIENDAVVKIKERLKGIQDDLQEAYNGRQSNAGEKTQESQRGLRHGTGDTGESKRFESGEDDGLAGRESERDADRVLPDVADAPLSTVRLNKQTRTEYVDPALYDQWLSEHPDFQSGNRNAYSLEDVPAVQSSGGWERGATFDEVKAAHPTLFELAADEAEVRNPTQITGTVKTYRKIYDILKAEGFKGKILDASSGLGVGTEAADDYANPIDISPDFHYNVVILRAQRNLSGAV